MIFKKSLSYITSIFIAAGVMTLSGCLGGTEDKTVLSSSAAATSITLLSYDNVNAQINVKGTVNIPGTVQLTSVVLHLDSACSDNALGQALQSDFPTTGINITIPSTQTVTIFVSTTTFTGCYSLGSYTTPHTAPPIPVVTSLSPASPSRVSTTPRIFGTQGGFASQLRFYNDATCTNLIGGGQPADFPTIGIQLSVPANTVTSIYGQAREAFGNLSVCTKVSSFTHSTIGPNPPVFVSVTPVSPSQVSSPTIVGTLPTDATVVSLFGDAGCSTQIGTGSAADFKASGLVANVATDSSTGIYGIAYDVSGNPSTCTYLTTFLSDTTPPVGPTYTSASPATPTRTTVYPRIKGTLPSIDSVQVKLYSDAACIRTIGTGIKSEFEGIGTTAGVYANDTTSIYGTAIDGAGNASTCTFLTSYYNNTIPPDPPVFITTDPISPNNKSGTPYIIGQPSTPTVSIQIYKDDQCAGTKIGQGSATAFQSPGIISTVPDNQDTVIYATGTDAEGNVSTCTTLTTYRYAVRPAIAPGYFQTIPKSPSRTSTTPAILGTADSTISSVQLFRDSACTGSIATGSRAAFTASGIQLTLFANSTNTIYAIASDVYGNSSACTHLTDYIHDSVAPYEPTYISTSPSSPTNQSTTPVIFGTTVVKSGKVLPISRVTISDSPGCTTDLGHGTPTDYSGAGVLLALPADTDTYLYGQTSDDAGNVSPCVALTDYFHNTIKPGLPGFISTTPASPSYTQLTSVLGRIGTTKSAMAPTSVVLYMDINCQNVISSGTPSAWQTSGIITTMPENSNTTVYASIFDSVGNVSGCTAQTSFLHNDIGPQNLTLAANLDGSVGLSWSTDTVASPSAKYVVKRSIRSGGPYTILSATVGSASYNDLSVTSGVTYYYVVAATNITGTSFDSGEQSILVSAPTPLGAFQLSAVPGSEAVALTWNGDNSDMTYSVFRSTQASGPYSVISSNLTSTSYSDNPLADGTKYYYIIKGANPAGTSIQSNEASAVPFAQPPKPLSLSLALTNKVTDPTSNCFGSRGVILTWTAPAYYARFAVSRAQNSGASNVLQTSTISGNTWIDCNPADYQNPTNNVNTNYYTVSAIWGTGTSPASNEVVMADNFIGGVYAYPGNNNVTLLWNADPNKSNFTVLRSQTSGGPYTTLQSGITSSQYVDSTATNGTGYYYIVRDNYINSGGPTDIFGWDSAEVAASPAAPVVAPTNLKLTVNASHQPVLDWTPPPYYNGFKIWRSTTPTGPFTGLTGTTDRLTNPTPLTYTDTSISNATGTKYYYAVSTSWGSADSSQIGPVSFQTGIPGSVVAAGTASSVDLTWTAISGATSYKVYRSLTAGGPYTTLVGSPSSNSFSDTSAAAATGYYYVVNAVFSGGTGPNSNEASGTRTGSTVPAGVSVIATSSNSISLQWTKVPNATAYYIYKSTAATGTYVKITGSTTALTSVITGLASNTNFYFKVSALVTTEQAQSAYAMGRTVSPPAAPTLTAGVSSIGIQCSTLSGATYDIQRCTTGLDTDYTTIISGLTNGSGTDSTASTGTLYYYRCVTNITGAPSMTSPGAPISAGLVAPAPGNLTVSKNVTGDALNITFAVVPGAQYYRIYAATGSGAYSSTAFTPASPSTNGTVTATVAGLTAGNIYYFVATSLIGANESARSPELQAIPLATPPAPTVTVNGTSSILISWPAVGYGTTSYNLLRSSDGLNYTTIKTNLGSATSYSDTTGVSGVPYTYYYLPIGTSSLPMAPSLISNTVSFGVAPVAPAGLVANATSTSSVYLTWIQVPNTTSYNVYRSSTSGSGYTLLHAGGSATTYQDTPSPGGSYFYIVRAVNLVNVESSNSNEAGVILSSIVTGVTAVASANGIDIGWTSSGASSYEVHRREASADSIVSYGFLAATNSSTTTFHDSNIKSGTTYYYEVNGIYANSTRTPNSAEASATALVIMNLQVPIELIDRGISSDVAPVTFERSRTTLNSTDYDGTITYRFEIIASNTGSADAVVSLVNSAGNSVSTITVLANTNTSKRFRVLFTPTSGYDEYRLALPATTNADSLVVQTARLLVNQTGATKTKLYIPLLASNDQPTHSDVSPVEFTNSSTYAELSTGSIYIKNSANLADLADQNAWEFEALASATATTRASAVLYNVSQNAIVSNTQTPISATSVSLIHAPFAEGSTNFAALNDGDQIEPSIRCELNCANGLGISLYKAGLWVRLTRLNKAEIYYRLARASSTFSDTVFDGERSFLNLSSFSNPTVNFLANGYTSPGDSATVQLITAGTSDQGIPAPLVPVAGSSLLFNSGSKVQSSTSAPLTINSGDRFLLDATPASGTFRIIDGFLKINAHPN